MVGLAPLCAVPLCGTLGNAAIAPVPPSPPPPPPPPPAPPLPPPLVLATVVDEDTLEAIRLLWQIDNVNLPTLFTQPVQAGRLKSPQKLPYAVATSELESRRLAGAYLPGPNAPKAWHDYRTVTITVYGIKAQVVQCLGAIQMLFNNDTYLTYPSGARFRRWEPTGDAHLVEDENVKDGLDIWQGIVKARVWSLRIP